MKAYINETKPNQLWFTNYDRVNERILFDEIHDTILKIPGLFIGDKIVGPYVDIYMCHLGSEEFEQIYDLDYGTFICSENRDVLNQIANFFH